MDQMLLQRIEAALAGRAFTEGSGILVAASGGPDSTALLYLAAQVCQPAGIHLLAVYVDHGLRPRETHAEISLVRQHTDRLGVEFARCQVDTQGHARSHGLSLEHAARDLRYEVLQGLADARSVAAILLGHTEDDQSEEVLLRLLRGGGRAALSGMRPSRASILRPFLNVRKRELLAYLQGQGIAYCIDSSNSDPRFLRNRIRHHLLPLLETAYDPGVRKALLKSAAILGEEDDLLTQMTEAAWQKIASVSTGGEAAVIELQRSGLLALHPALQRRLLEMALHKLGASPRYAHIMAIIDTAARDRGRRELHLAKGLRVEIHGERLSFSYPRGRQPWRGRLHEG